jgi:hypothetical protein
MEDSRNTDLTVRGTQAFLSAQNISKTGTWYKDDQGAVRIKRKLFGKSPWYRKVSGDTCSSVNSSVRNVLRGNTPPVTPMSERIRNGE